ncbi:pyrroloquinoline quinone biosynthesis protein PqqB [Sporosarcina sp. BI001-red]|uniref:MBL fold metallo-hydrolase n=1 Tax=Sporosarcina sp. BI001-red TaxID=2282866 RepID=UPI000E227BF0|nr:MBL fold metallo-hydrolase [Sporosarcina sp. BI001-red]REB07454.1 pyrroloquinoline quinone biosynthesis protein PqqB [Sporosarcina sp. BI001-red]
MGEVILHVLGTAQDAGLPQPNCYCDNCTKAIDNPTFKRRAASLAIVLKDKNQWHLIDASPDFKEQIIMVQRTHGMEGLVMDSIFLTHAHIGHYPGLIFLGKEAMNTKNVPVFTGPLMKNVLESHAPWRQLTDLGNIQVQAIEQGISTNLDNDVEVTPVKVPHRNEFSETFGFWIKGPKKKVLYIPDIDSWDEWDLDLVEACKQADICLLDATFFSESDLSDSGRGARDLSEIPHPFITDTMERLKSITDTCAIYFTHFNHSNPALKQNSDARDFIEKNGFHIANDGMTFDL